MQLHLMHHISHSFFSHPFSDKKDVIGLKCHAAFSVFYKFGPVFVCSGYITLSLTTTMILTLKMFQLWLYIGLPHFGYVGDTVLPCSSALATNFWTAFLSEYRWGRNNATLSSPQAHTETSPHYHRDILRSILFSIFSYVIYLTFLSVSTFNLSSWFYT